MLPALARWTLEGETLADIVRRNRAIGFDLRFSRSVTTSPDDRDTVSCEPSEAEFTTLYALTDLGEAIAIHDVHLTSARADEVAAISRALFIAMVIGCRDPPDAAQLDEAEQAALTDHDQIG